MKQALIRFFTNRYLLYALFWVYNGIYMLFVSTTAPFLFQELSNAAQEIPWNVAVMAYILLLTPAAAIAVGAFTRLRKDPKKLVTLLFCIEMPLIFLALIRMIFIRQMTPVLWYFTLGSFVSVIGTLFLLFKEQARTKLQQALYTASQGAALLLAGYGALLALFFLPIIIAFFIRGFISFPYLDVWETLVDTKGLAFFSILFSLLLGIVTLGFFLASPIITTTLYARSFLATLTRLQKHFSVRVVGGVTGAATVLLIFIGVLLSLQSGKDISMKYQAINTQHVDTFAEQQELAATLVQEEEELRRDLRTAYLAKYRYIGDASSNILTEGYQTQVGFTKENAEGFQRLFNHLASPFIYRGTFNADVERAEKQYRALFDTHIQDGEKEAIRDALSSTNTRDPLKASLLDRDETHVHVAEHLVSANMYEDIGMAVVQVEESYTNTTDEFQEVFYTFSLPESAVMTGLWLGPELEYEGVIAPKGAARRTYENQIRLRPVDPALLEQVGPRQYTLRVFPIPPEGQLLTGEEVDKGVVIKPQRIRFEYTVPHITRDIPLPVIAEERNVYRDQHTIERITVDGRAAEARNGMIARNTQTPCPTNVVQTPVPGVPDQMFLYIPHSQNPIMKGSWSCANELGDPLAAIRGQRIALMIDTSYSNRDFDIPAFLNEQMPLARLAEQGNTVDLFYFNTILSERIALTPESVAHITPPIPFGGTDRIRALDALPAGYSAVFLVTDASAEDEETTIAKPNAEYLPLYLIHPNGRFPAYHDALTHRILTNRGAVVSSPEEALAHLGTTQTLHNLALPVNGNSTAPTAVIGSDAYGVWLKTAMPTNDLLPWLTGDITLTVAGPDPLQKTATALWARSLIAAGKPAEDIHRIVEQSPAVTPYSSFIALVTRGQEQQLERAAGQDDAFEVTFDVTGGEILNHPMGQAALTVGGVPEPEEWALIFCGIGLLLFHQRRRVSALVRASINRGS
ncbi:MAG: hypothetical protein RL141_831 [Candidatus Parcubacteria bacterium]|jgi:hypothetical protein